MSPNRLKLFQGYIIYRRRYLPLKRVVDSHLVVVRHETVGLPVERFLVVSSSRVSCCTTNRGKSKGKGLG